MAIREYSYVCDTCDTEFSDFCNWEDVANYLPPCPECKTNKFVNRDYTGDLIAFVDNTPRTVGGLADKNAEKRHKEGKTDKDR